MRDKRYTLGCLATIALITVALFATTPRATAQEQVLHSFGQGNDGISPVSSLVFDAAGNLYGTTEDGGIHGNGMVFELSPRQGGGWTERVLHSFGNGTDGQTPAAGLAFDSAGNLYGTTQGGGLHAAGTVYELTPLQGGGWSEKVLRSFGGGVDGAYPAANLLVDNAGDLYGTTSLGGTEGGGTVFEMLPRQGGGWSEKILYNFGSGSDGAYPDAGLIVDASGNFYGTTSGGGIHFDGAVFELSPSNGGWSETILHSFGHASDGSDPEAALTFDSAGNLYGTTNRGGIHSLGTVFELTPREGGGWTESVLHSFGEGTDGQLPLANLIPDSAGNLYGTTSVGGIHTSGTLFKMAPVQGGGWTETVLHSFGKGTDGVTPYAGLIFDGAGNLYGTTNVGGIHASGTAFEFRP
jgi:uncharacterized repeat protein (TIGR03803 family)